MWPIQNKENLSKLRNVIQVFELGREKKEHFVHIGFSKELLQTKMYLRPSTQEIIQF